MYVNSVIIVYYIVIYILILINRKFNRAFINKRGGGCVKNTYI